MFGLKKKYLWGLMIFSALISPFVFFSSSLKSWVEPSRFVLIWQEAIFPVEYGWHRLVSSIRETWKEYVFLHNAAVENNALKEQLLLLKARIMDYEHQVGEANRLRKLLGFTEQFHRNLTVAEVIGSNAETPFQSLRIVRGSLDDLRVGMPVIAAQGIVGRVLRVGLKFSDIQLIGDANFNLDVIVERSRVRGVLRGVGENRCRLQLHRQAEIRIGDTIVTSGITGSFPKGLSVGRVVKISYESDNVSQIISIQPWVDYHGLEEVVLLRYADDAVDMIDEVGGKEWMSSSVGKLDSNVLK